MNKQITTCILNKEAIQVPTKRESYIRLDLNESNGFWDIEMLNKVLDINQFVLETYPEYEALFTELTDYTRVPKENISITNGSDHAIELLINLLFKSGDNVILPEPTFYVYNHMLTQAGVRYTSISYSLGANEFEFPTTEVLAALDNNTQGLLLCNPANPTGSIISETDLLLLIEKTSRLNIPIIIDEAYFEYYGKSSISFVSKYNHIIIIRTLSKGFGLAGIRFGYIIACTSLVEELRKLQLPWSVSHPATKIATYCLQNNKRFEKKRQALLKRKALLKDKLKTEPITIYNSYGNFILCKVEDPERVYCLMKDQGILIGQTYKLSDRFPILTNTIRIGIPTNNEFDFVLEKFKTVLS